MWNNFVKSVEEEGGIIKIKYLPYFVKLISNDALFETRKDEITAIVSSRQDFEVRLIAAEIIRWRITPGTIFSLLTLLSKNPKVENIANHICGVLRANERFMITLAIEHEMEFNLLFSILLKEIDNSFNITNFISLYSFYETFGHRFSILDRIIERIMKLENRITLNSHRELWLANFLIERSKLSIDDAVKAFYNINKEEPVRNHHYSKLLCFILSNSRVIPKDLSFEVSLSLTLLMNQIQSDSVNSQSMDTFLDIIMYPPVFFAQQFEQILKYFNKAFPMFTEFHFVSVIMRLNKGVIEQEPDFYKPILKKIKENFVAKVTYPSFDRSLQLYVKFAELELDDNSLIFDYLEARIEDQSHKYLIEEMLQIMQIMKKLKRDNHRILNVFGMKISSNPQGYVMWVEEISNAFSQLGYVPNSLQLVLPQLFAVSFTRKNIARKSWLGLSKLFLLSSEKSKKTSLSAFTKCMELAISKHWIIYAKRQFENGQHLEKEDTLILMWLANIFKENLPLKSFLENSLSLTQEYNPFYYPHPEIATKYKESGFTENHRIGDWILPLYSKVNRLGILFYDEDSHNSKCYTALIKRYRIHAAENLKDIEIRVCSNKEDTSKMCFDKIN